MFAGIVIGIAVGYLFKPQIDFVVKKVIKLAKKNLNEGEDNKESAQE